MRSTISHLVLVSLLSLFLAAAPAPMRIDVALGRHLLLAHKIPEWTFADRKKHYAGGGDFDIEFDYESGLVSQVRVVQSTGHESLDNNIIIGLKRWRAKPGTVHVLRVPITYTMGQV